MKIEIEIKKQRNKGASIHPTGELKHLKLSHMDLYSDPINMAENSVLLYIQFIRLQLQWYIYVCCGRESYMKQLNAKHWKKPMVYNVTLNRMHKTI